LFHTILTAIELSRENDNIINTGLNLAKCCTARLCVLYVVDYHLPDHKIDEKSRAAEIQFQKKYEPLLGGFKNYSFDCRVGVPAFEIARFAKSIDADCIIIGCHKRKDGRSVISRLGETALELLELVTRPVMVVQCTSN